MPKGPAPKPTILKILEGNPGHRPLNQNEPKPKIEGVRCPGWLDPEAKRTWRRLYPELQRLGLLSVVDVDSFLGYCEATAKVKHLTLFIRERGMSTVTATGYPVPRPELKELNAAWARIRAFASDFGLNPSARSRIKVEAPKDVDPFEEYLSQGTS